MKKLILLLSILNLPVQAQEQIRQDAVTIGKPSTSTDKTLKFDTNDGVSNPSLSVEKVSKKLKYNQNNFQLGGSSTTDSKSIIFNGDNKSLLYEGTANELQYNGDTVSVGDGTNTNKVLKFNKGASSPQLRWNSSTSKLEFSNDATIFKNIGAGGGATSSGVNILTNDSFEDPITSGWTNSGGTFTQQSYTNSSENDLKYGRFVATTSGQYVESTTVAIPDSFTGGCQADFKKYNTTVSNGFKIQALDNSNNVLSEQTLSSGTWIKAPAISFTCPVVGSLVKFRLISLGAGQIEFDRGYLGSNQNLVYTSQARLLGEVTYGATSSFSTTSTTFVTATSASQSASYSGEITAPVSNTNAYGFRITNAKAGVYEIRASGFDLYTGTATSNIRFTASFGSDDIATATNCGKLMTNGNTASVADAQEAADFTCSYSTGTNLTNKEFFIKLKGSSAQTGILTAETGAKISVYYYPSSSEVAVSPEQANWLIDANIGGSGVIGLSNSAISSYTDIVNANLDLVINTNKGSANAEIACATGTASVGLTCNTPAVNESVGIAFIPPYAGLFETCFDFSTDQYGANTYQLIETPNNSNSILQEGGSRFYNYGGSSSNNAGLPNKVCGTFNFSDTSKRTIRLMREQVASTNETSLLVDRNATLGQRDLHITVRPLLSPTSRPVLVDTPIVSSLYYLSANFASSASIPINFDAKEYESSHNAVTPSSTAWKFTCPFGQDGNYSVSVNLQQSAGGTVFLFIYKNGTLYKPLGNVFSTSGSIDATTTIRLSAGDYIDIRPSGANTYIGGSLGGGTNVGTVSITRVGK